MIAFALLVVTMLASAVAAARTQTDTVRKLYRALGTSSPTIATFTKLFGGDNEAEVDTLLAIYYRGNVPDTVPDEKAVNYTRRVTNPKNNSEFLRCIHRLRPELFSATTMVKVETQKRTGDDSFDRIPVVTRGGELIFVFSKGENTIEDITMPDGSSVYVLIPECGRSSPSSRSAGSPEAPR